MSYTNDWLSGAGSFISGVGTTLGLPEWGISEFVSGQPKPANQSVFGVSTSDPYAGAYSTPQIGPVYTGPQNNTPTRTTSSVPTQIQSVSAPSGPSQDQLIADIYNPIYNYLNQAESTVKAAYPQVQSDIAAQYQNSKNSLTQQNQEGLGQIASQEAQANQRSEDASTAAVRLYNELSRGGNQRFGGASSAGQAFGELTANELQRNQGNIQKQLATTIQQLNTYKQNLNDKFSLALADLESQKNSALNSAQQDYNNQLLQISQFKAQAESDKAAARNEALQSLRNQINSINLQTLQFKQQLATQQQQSNASIDAYGQQAIQLLTQGSGAVSGLLNNTTTNPTSGLAIGSGQAVASATPTGAISQGNRKYDIYGNPIA